MKARISELIEHLGFSQAQFADQIGVKRSIINHILTGRNKPSLEVVMKILSTYKQLSPDWLIYGEEPMMRIKGERKEVVATASEMKKNVHHITIYYDDNTYSNYYPDNKN